MESLGTSIAIALFTVAGCRRPRARAKGLRWQGPYSAKILAGPLDQVILMSPPFGVTGSPVTPVSI
jgi:hypothetical protein